MSKPFDYKKEELADPSDIAIKGIPSDPDPIKGDPYIITTEGHEAILEVLRMYEVILEK